MSVFFCEFFFLLIAVSETSFLSNDSRVELTLNSSEWSFGQSGSVWFRTREMDGLLMYAGRRPGGGNTEFMLLEVFSGQARFTADLGSGMVKVPFILCYFYVNLFISFFLVSFISS